MQSPEGSVKHFTMAGYSGTPLPQKLGIKPGMIVVAIDAPENYRQLLGQIPSGVNFATRPVGNTKFIHLFVTRRTELASQLSILRQKLPRTPRFGFRGRRNLPGFRLTLPKM